ncbi:hypothetical protein Q2361_24515, partial [Escherichia coli]|nr:hypothetical protein [Escherichia coli]
TPQFPPSPSRRQRQLCIRASGSRAISQMLRQSSVDAGRGLARRLMRECGLTSRQMLKHHYRVNEDKSPPLQNFLTRKFPPAAP